MILANMPPGTTTGSSLIYVFSCLSIETHSEAEVVMVGRDEDEEAFLRSVTFPEEDRRLFTTAPWRGEFRWFRSPNIIPLEQRRKRKPDSDTNAAASASARNG